MPPQEATQESNHAALTLERLRAWGEAAGFSQIGVAEVDLHTAEPGLRAWLAAGFHGQMAYMARHGMARARPAELVPGTVRVITVRMDYLPMATAPGWQAEQGERQLSPGQAVVSRYAQGRDYHKVLRQRLEGLAQQLAREVAPHHYRVFTDSAPVLEAELATRSGLGWRGKHTLVLNREAGSMFFLGEIFTDMPLPATPAQTAHCGSCKACMVACPTQAIVAPYRVDARRCISYLTIELEGTIPVEFRSAIGNRIYGCDDCQLACPWNKYAQVATVPDFDVRHGLDSATLLALWAWTEAQFLQRMEGSAMRRIGWRRWRRNLAVGLGNALRSGEPVREALMQAPDTDEVVREHITWALAQAQHTRC